MLIYQARLAIYGTLCAMIWIDKSLGTPRRGDGRRTGIFMKVSKALRAQSEEDEEMIRITMQCKGIW